MDFSSSEIANLLLVSGLIDLQSTTGYDSRDIGLAGLWERFCISFWYRFQQKALKSNITNLIHLIDDFGNIAFWADVSVCNVPFLMVN